MPKAAMDEYCNPLPSEYNIGSAEQRWVMNPVSKARAVQRDRRRLSSGAVFRLVMRRMFSDRVILVFCGAIAAMRNTAIYLLVAVSLPGQQDGSAGRCAYGVI